MKNEEIIEGLLIGDTKTIDFIYKKINITSILYRYNIYSTTVDDVFQESIIGTIENIKKKDFKLRCDFFTYFYSICERLILKSYSKNEKKMFLEYDFSYGDNIIDETQIEPIYDKELLTECLKSLSETERKLLSLYYSGYNMDEIANDMSFSNRNVVKTKKYKTMSKLKKIFKNKKLSKKDFIFA